MDSLKDGVKLITKGNPKITSATKDHDAKVSDQQRGAIKEIERPKSESTPSADSAVSR